MAFNIFDFSNLGGNQLGKAVSTQKLPTVAPFNPWVQPTYSPTPKTTVWGGEQQINTMNAPQGGIYNSLYNLGGKIFDVSQNAQLKQEWNIIQAFLNETKDKADFKKKRDAVIQMIQNWEDDSFIENAIKNNMWYDVSVWIGGRVAQAVWRRAEIAQESLSTNKTLAEKWLSAVKDIASLPFDITGGIIAPVIEPVLKPVMESETVQGIASEYGKFREQNPRLAQNIEATVWLGTILAPWTKAGQQVIKVPWKVAKEWAKMVGKWVSKIPEAIGWVGEQWVSTVVGLSREAQKTIKQTPELYKQARTWKITTGGELENFVSATDKRLQDISELGKWYEKVRKWAVVSNADEISNIYLNTTKDTPITQLTKADVKILGDASDYMSQLKWNVTDADLMALRRQLDSVVYDPNTWMKRKLSPQGSILIQKMRAGVDNIAKERIPWLKELDAKYAPEVTLLRDIKSKIYDANGNLKENALSTISQVVGKNKAMRLDKFEQIYPQLWAKMRALKAFEEVQAISEIKTWSIARQLSWPVIWSAIAPWIGTIAWWIVTNPNIVARILETYGMAKNKIKSLISKWKKITPQEAKEVHDIVKAIPKAEVEKIITKTPTVKVSAIPANWPITLWKQGKTIKRPVLQSPTAFEKGYTMSIKKPIVKQAGDIEWTTFASKENPVLDWRRLIITDSKWNKMTEDLIPYTDRESYMKEFVKLEKKAQRLNDEYWTNKYFVWKEPYKYNPKPIVKKSADGESGLIEEAKKIWVDLNKYFENVSEKSAIKMADYASNLVEKKMIKWERPMNISELGMLSNKINKNEAGGNITTVWDILQDKELRTLYKNALDTPVTILDASVAKKWQLWGYVPMWEWRYWWHIILFWWNKEISNNLPKSILHEAAHAIRDWKWRKLEIDYR